MASRAFILEFSQMLSLSQYLLDIYSIFGCVFHIPNIVSYAIVLNQSQPPPPHLFVPPYRLIPNFIGSEGWGEIGR